MMYSRYVVCLFGFLICSLQTARADSPAASRFPILDNHSAWNRLPPAKNGQGAALPVWARVLCKTMPLTTAGMLELDYLHRAKCPLDPKLRGKLRWIAADANRCDYSKRIAEADLIRAGVTKDALSELGGDHSKLPNSEQQTLAFARKMTLRAATVTDDEFAQMLKLYGPEKMTAIVIVLAHANFQDRIFLSLGIIGEGDAAPPLEVQFAKTRKLKIPPPKRVAWKDIIKESSPLDLARPQWGKKSYMELQKDKEHQRSRPPRIPVPTDKQLSAKLPKAAKSRAQTNIVWSRVCMGYQPKLTMSWFQCMGTFGRESGRDRVFSNSMFWVITRSNECFY